MLTFPLWVKSSWIPKIQVEDAPAGLDDPCWLWLGACTPDGYGRVNVEGRKGRQIYLHRYAFERHVGAPIPEGVDGAHLCHRSLCFQPTHIEAQTQKKNRSDTSAVKFERSPLSPADLAALADTHWIVIAHRAAFR